MTDDPGRLATPPDGVPRARGGSGQSEQGEDGGFVIPLPIVVLAKILYSIEGLFRWILHPGRRRRRDL